MIRGFLGLGSNLGDKRARLAAAITALGCEAGIEVRRVANFYRTAPMGPVEQDWFLNTVVEIGTTLSPQELLAAARRVEVALGRVRQQHWGPRTIDVDLLWLDGCELATEELTLPHPGAHQRSFVLKPWLDLAPDLRLRGRSLGEWLAQADSLNIEQVPMPPSAIAQRWADAPAPTAAFARLAEQSGPCWLDSSLPRESDGRYSIMSCAPRWRYTARGEQWSLVHADGRAESGVSGALENLETRLRAAAVMPPLENGGLPFCGGAVGCLSYDLGRVFEQMGEHASDDLECPDIQLAWYEAAVIWDHQAGETWLAGTNAAAVAELKARLISSVSEPIPNEKSSAPGEAVSDFTRADYMARVTEAREGIARGEYYQLNLVQRFECALRESPATVYRRLRELNPAPFSAYLAMGEWTVLSSSPERFLEVSPTREVRTCPIKGTRPRGQTPAEDRSLVAELLANEKERAELLMIVDMLRNDLGRVCTFGSVEVKRLHALETFATVHHLVGEVTGRLRADVGLAELLKAVFPGGSITGAPKVSAMRAIEKLEPHRRGLGMGAIGYLSAHGRMDFNIAIRTIMARQGRAYVPVGAGIVADSDPAAEYAETLAKAQALFAALGVEGGEA